MQYLFNMNMSTSELKTTQNATNPHISFQGQAHSHSISTYATQVLYITISPPGQRQSGFPVTVLLGTVHDSPAYASGPLRCRPPPPPDEGSSGRPACGGSGGGLSSRAPSTRCPTISESWSRRSRRHILLFIRARQLGRALERSNGISNGGIRPAVEPMSLRRIGDSEIELKTIQNIALCGKKIKTNQHIAP